MCVCFVFFFKQKTAYEMRISDWSSDVCSSDLQTLADIIIGVAEDFEPDALAQKRAQRLARTTAQADMDMPVSQRGHAELLGDPRRKPRANREMRVTPRIGEPHLFAPLATALSIVDHLSNKKNGRGFVSERHSQKGK